MVRIVEGEPGQVAEVWIQDRGTAAPRLRGRIVIEDLSDVLTCISSRNGANGPQNPVTQYILARAAEHLADRLVDDGIVSPDGRESVPRTLSGTLGHQPFIESVLNMSQHQMLRRWPLATDWYQDVINYVMRPSRFDLKTHAALDQFGEWARGPFGDFVRQFSEAVLLTDESPKILRMVEALQSLWPEYPPVRNAVQVYRQRLRDVWEPLYLEVMRLYGLKLRPEVTITELAWAFNALQSRETFERLVDPQMAAHLAVDGTPWSFSGRAGLMVIAGAVTDADGRPLTIPELLARQPEVRP